MKHEFFNSMVAFLGLAMGAGLAHAAQVDARALVSKYGEVIKSQPIIGGLTAWVVEKNGNRVVLYTTADSSAILHGVVWDAVTGRNVSDDVTKILKPGATPVAHAAVPKAQQTSVQSSSGVMSTPYKGPVPESIKAIDGLAGIKEGKGGPADTLYIIFDPRCPYCRKAFGALRPYVAKGFTVKWIPAVVLGDPQEGEPLAATMLQASENQRQEILIRMLGNKEQISTKPTTATKENLARNAAFFMAAFQNKGAGGAGVPVAFFLDHVTGKARMMTGISEIPVIEDILGRP